MYVIGTAGHVDHGKSTLVESLTGIDPDRFQEEKDRGMTIDIGFAWITLPSGREVSIVDVPGHEKFVSNMLAGVGGVDMALLVVAADESVMPQTREHLAILDLLGVTNGVVVVTKEDLVDKDWLELVYGEVEELLAGTTLEGAEIISASATTGSGISDLMHFIDLALDKTTAKKDFNKPRLPIDRSFSISGFGTVVTGTLIDGFLSVGQEIEIIPIGLKARIRGLQSHGKSETSFGPGTRVAANLSGIESTQITRGDVLSPPNFIDLSEAFDVRLNVVEDAPNPLRHNMFVTLHTGSSEVVARLRLLEGEEVQPGNSTWAQLKPEKSLPVLRGDHYIIRSNMTTLGGGSIVDTQAKRHRRRHSPTIQKLESLESDIPSQIILNMIESSSPATLSSLLSGSKLQEEEIIPTIDFLIAEKTVMSTSLDVKKSYFFTVKRWEEICDLTKQSLNLFHVQFPLRQGMPREELRNKMTLSSESFNAVVDVLEEIGLLRNFTSIIAFTGHKSHLTEEQKRVSEAYVENIAKDKFSPRTDVEIDEDILSFLVDKGRLVRVSDGIVFSSEAFKEMSDGVRAYISQHGQITVGDFRDLFQTSRKYALGFMDYMDQQQITRRVGDARILRE
ncbi:MAG: selenocysteine-specific translation elongation factor [SAR202 cluster bacterium]|nr:selenocysteine-specific translation elongation factor [SAR202 cluster bacterium]HJO59243.1 selenocysteine-specific translation elongation factor [SAR202 cluster bacterium]